MSADSIMAELHQADAEGLLRRALEAVQAGKAEACALLPRIENSVRQWKQSRGTEQNQPAPGHQG